MPTYEYECTGCGRVFELFQSITEKPRTRVAAELKGCTCKARVRRRIGSGAGIIFKGSGFYQTDYRSESYKNAAKADKEAATGGDGKSDKTAKPADKAEKTTAKPEAKASGDKASKKSA